MTFIWASLIAFLAGAASYYSWDRNKALSLFAAVVAVIAALLGSIMAFFSAVVFFIRLIPFLLLLGTVFILCRILTKDKD